MAKHCKMTHEIQHGCLPVGFWLREPAECQICNLFSNRSNQTWKLTSWLAGNRGRSTTSSHLCCVQIGHVSRPLDRNLVWKTTPAIWGLPWKSEMLLLSHLTGVNDVVFPGPYYKHPNPKLPPELSEPSFMVKSQFPLHSFLISSTYHFKAQPHTDVAL